MWSLDEIQEVVYRLREELNPPPDKSPDEYTEEDHPFSMYLAWAERHGIPDEVAGELNQAQVAGFMERLPLMGGNVPMAVGLAVGEAFMLGVALGESRVQDSDLPDLSYVREPDRPQDGDGEGAA